VVWTALLVRQNENFLIDKDIKLLLPINNHSAENGTMVRPKNMKGSNGEPVV
jgi:hypothetical protein